MLDTKKLMEVAERFWVSPSSIVMPRHGQDLPQEFAEKEHPKIFPDQYAFILDNVELLGPIGVCYWDGDLVLDVAYFGRMDLWDRNRPYFNQAIEARMKYSPTMGKAGGVYCSLMGVWSGNYFHWNLEILPMLKAVKLYEEIYHEEVTLLVEHFAKPWVYQSLGAFGMKNIRPIQHMNYSIDRLIVPPPGRRDGYTLLPSIDFLQTNNVYPRSVKMIYISRSDATKRQITNESEVISFLSERGFSPVVLSGMSWQDQVSLFKGANIVIGPHGAGLTNIAYCKPGTKVIEIATPEYFNPCFYTLAAAAYCDYRLLIGDPQPGENISVRLEQLDAELQELT